MVVKQYIVYLMIFLGVGGIFLYSLAHYPKAPIERSEQQNSRFPVAAPLPTASPKPTATPTPKPLTFAEMNNLYGPCVHLPVVMYHHIQDEAIAKSGGFAGLNVTPAYFKMHLQYLKDKGYQAVEPFVIRNFFDNGVLPPAKSVMLTFDDGYDDFYFVAYPILKEFSDHAVLFTPTGLINNTRYTNWDRISEMANSGLVYFANHTWSHHSVAKGKDVIEKEIDIAAQMLADRGYDQDKVFAYPYGERSQDAINHLNDIGYSMAFTTKPGSTLCKKLRFELPRVRAGNAALSRYGL